MRYEIEKFNPPLKKELPLLHYDVACYCSEFCKQTHDIWPEYLPNFKNKMRSYSKQAKRLHPNPSQIPSEIRVYFFDYRLSLLFAALDETGEMATFISKFCAQFDKHNMERYYYGNGSKVGDTYPCKINGELTFVPDYNELQSFNQAFGFVPAELFSQSAALIFQADTLLEWRPMTTEHCVLLMEKFHAKNLVDLKAIVRGFYLADVF